MVNLAVVFLFLRSEIGFASPCRFVSLGRGYRCARLQCQCRNQAITAGVTAFQVVALPMLLVRFVTDRLATGYLTWHGPIRNKGWGMSHTLTPCNVLVYE